MNPPFILRRRLPLATLIIAAIALIAALIVTACNAQASNSTSARISISDNYVGQAVPKSFLGISMEETSLEYYAGRNPAAIDPGFINLLRNLEPSGNFILRLGGDSTDWGWWPIPGESTPVGIRFNLTPNFAAIVRNTAEKVGGRVILGVNLEANSRRIAGYEAKELLSHVGRSAIDYLELGNEPELYSGFAWYHTKSGVGVKGRPPSWSTAEYNRDFASILSGIAPGTPIAGPSSGSANWLKDLSAFAGQESRVGLLTVHAYPLKHCSANAHNVPADFFESSSLQGLANNIAGHVEVGYHHHRPVRVDEMNSITCGGQKGLSTAFAPALWALDMLPRVVRTGAAGVNFHTVPGSIQDILSASKHGSTWSVGVEPEYYGLLAFAQAAPSGSHMLRTDFPNEKNLDVWADKATNGVEHVVIINSGSGALTANVSLKDVKGTVSLTRLQAPKGMLSTSGTTLGGQRIASTGKLSGASNAATVNAKNGVYSVRVPGAGAAILTVSAS